MFYDWVYGPTQFAWCRCVDAVGSGPSPWSLPLEEVSSGFKTGEGVFVVFFLLTSVSGGPGGGPLAVRGGDCGWGTLAGCWLKPGSQAGSHCKLERACRLLQQHSALLALWLGERGLPLRAH